MQMLELVTISYLSDLPEGVTDNRFDRKYTEVRATYSHNASPRYF